MPRETPAKRSSPRRDHGALGIKPVYKVTELARAAGMTPQSFARMLEKRGVTYLTDDPRRVTISELRRCFPELLNAIDEARALSGS